MVVVDLNCDLGESFGSYIVGNDPAMVQEVSSVNVACGFHAGDPGVMERTVKTAEAANIGIGAHPGYPDLQGFGRRYMAFDPKEVQQLVTYQIGALAAFTQQHRLHHVKPHGALYNAAAHDRKLALAICRAVKDFDPNLPIYGLANSELILAAKELALPYAQEVFGDRNYQEDGSLVPRSQAYAVLSDPDEIAERVAKMIRQQAVVTLSGKEISLKPDTICVHGDNPAALAAVRAIRKRLAREQIEIRPFFFE